MLDKSARTIQPKPNPSNAGTEHLVQVLENCNRLATSTPFEDCVDHAAGTADGKFILPFAKLLLSPDLNRIVPIRLAGTK